MTDITHPEMVAALVKPGDVIAAEMTATEADLWHAATGVAGETTEIMEAAITASIKNDLDRENMVEELGDMEFYIEQTRQNLGITREETLACVATFYVSPDLFEAAACLCVAGGKLLDAVKKVVVYKKPADREQMIERLAHVEVGMMGLYNFSGVSRDEALAGNIAKLSVRYAGLKYSNEAAQVRADKAEGE